MENNYTHSHNRSFYFWCALVFSLLATAIHLYTIQRYSSGFPYKDDYEAIFCFLTPFLSGHFPDNIPLLFGQNNEHRIFLDNLISLFIVALTGHFNFYWMIWIGNIGWFLLPILFWKFSKKSHINFIEFSPILIVMMCLSHYELMTMAMAAVQHYFQVFFCVLSVWYLVSGRRLFALTFFVCAIFTSGGGICLVPVILLYYLSRKEWRNLVTSVIIIGIVFIIYFPLLGFTKPPTHPNILLALQSPLYLITYVFGFLGNLGNTYKSSIGLGVIFTVYLISKWRFLSTKYPFLFWLVAYLFVTAMTNAITRGGLGIRTGQGSRYTIYSIIFFSIVYFSFLLSASSAKKRMYVANISFVLSLGIFAYWFQHGQENIASRYEDLESGVIQHPNPEFAVSTLKGAADLGYYYPSKTLLPAIEPKADK